MTVIKLQFRPGINRDQTDYSGEGGWWDCDKVRFRSGYPQKIGGWVKSALDSFLGVCRQMCIWVTSYGDNILALGTNIKVYLEVGGAFNDITPLRTVDPTFATTITDNCVFTSNGSKTVTITLTVPHEAVSGSYVTISGVTGTVGGIPNTEINANHEITIDATDNKTFYITSTTAASSTVTGGGGTTITIDFEIEPGYASTTYGYGWGTGTYGRGTWGSGSTQPVLLPQRDWWFDTIDNDLIMNIRNGAPYYWARGTDLDPTTALATRAVRLQTIASDGGYDPDAVPSAVMQIMMSQQNKITIAFGAVPFGSTDPTTMDPLLIRWADEDNPGQWTPAPTNSAGFIRISRGSLIVRALPTRQEILVFTDTTLYALQYLGTTDVFGLQEYANNISIISPRACATAAGVTYWMGLKKFYTYTGTVGTLACTLRNYIFENLNYVQVAQIVCGTNEEWNEIWWFYPSADSNWNNQYVIFNYLEQLWYYGTMERTAWLDSSLRTYPQAASSADGSTGYIYSHESGVDDDASPMSSFVTSNDFDVGDGEQFMLSRRIIPDMNFGGSTADAPEVTLELRSRDFPGNASSTNPDDTQRVISTTADQYTQQIFIRARARQMAIKIMSENLGVQWQLGSPRIDTRTDGKR